MKLARISIHCLLFAFAAATPAAAIDLGDLVNLGSKLVKINSEVSVEEEIGIGRTSRSFRVKLC